MSKTAAEIMDRNFIYASLADSIPKVVQELGGRGLGSIPVLDLAGHPVGMATLAELESCRHFGELERRLTRSVVTAPQNTSIEAAAHTLALRNADGLVLVDEGGVAVGVLTALDLLRALLGLGSSPRAEQDAAVPLGVWSKSAILELAAVHHVRAVPGVILLCSRDDEEADSPVWVEASEDMGGRLDAMLRLPQDEPKLETLLAVFPRKLRFRVLVVYDAEHREHLAQALAHDIAGSTADPPRACSLDER